MEGGIEFLVANGFEAEMTSTSTNSSSSSSISGIEKVLHLKHSNSESLRNGIVWLNETVSTCIQMKMSRNVSSESQCAECQIQIKLPNSSVVSGGFMKYDLLRDVHSYALCYFQDGWYAT